MATIICIETATPVCSAALVRDGKVIRVMEVAEGFVHSEMLLPFIASIMNESGVKRKEIDAIAVSSGPGSYTGLRIGVSAAKGLCYALDKPLISVPTLTSLAWAMKEKLLSGNTELADNILLSPMIDARRMEVYTALFDLELKEQMPQIAIVIEEDSFADSIKEKRIYFAGDGSAKCIPVLSANQHADFSLKLNATAASMAIPAEEKFNEGNFENLALFEPFYLKEYQAGKSSL